MAKYLDLNMDQGSTFRATLPPVTNPNNSVKDLTNYSVTSYIRRSYSIQYAVALTVTVPTPTNGIITLSLDPAQTAGINATRWVYDVIITNDDDEDDVTKVFEGLVFVNPSVTAKPNTSLLTPYVPDDYGGI